jgi:hypothetical protein
MYALRQAADDSIRIAQLADYGPGRDTTRHSINPIGHGTGCPDEAEGNSREFCKVESNTSIAATSDARGHNLGQMVDLA